MHEGSVALEIDSSRYLDGLGVFRWTFYVRDGGSDTDEGKCGRRELLDGDSFDPRGIQPVRLLAVSMRRYGKMQFV